MKINWEQQYQILNTSYEVEKHERKELERLYENVKCCGCCQYYVDGLCDQMEPAVKTRAVHKCKEWKPWRDRV